MHRMGWHQDAIHAGVRDYEWDGTALGYDQMSAPTDGSKASDMDGLSFLRSCHCDELAR